MKTALIFSLLVVLPIAVFGNLAVSGKHFTYNGTQVFLSGVNFAWDSYARDFGGGAYASVKSKMEGWLASVAKAGGNAVRTWLHVDGQYSPKFDSSGHASGSDVTTLVSELGEFLDAAQKQGIFVILVLWNGATKASDNVLKLYKDDAALTAYINNVLTPMAKGLASKKALASWEIGNELIGGNAKQSVTDTNKCFDTTKLANSGADWANTDLTMKQILNFVNKQAAAIKTAAPGVLVTSGAWTETPNTEACSNCYNYYKDECLKAAGGMANGVLDYYQIHTYTYQGKFSDYSVMKKNAADLNLDKAVIIGEFSTDCSESKDAATNWKHAYNGGYAGVLSWQYNEGGDCSDKQASQNTGMAAITSLTTNGKIRVTI
jgi:mannan endo-1,4-beta-mannosidase